MVSSFTIMENTLLTIFLAGILAGALPKSVVGQNVPPPTNDVVVGDIVTDDFFNEITSESANCGTTDFYTRSVFLEALNSYTQFGRVGSTDDSKREIAAFFAHAAFETSDFCFIDEADGHSAKFDYCDKSNTQYPCNSSVEYYGRGPLNLRWNYNYGPAGESIGFDGLNSPETLVTNHVLSFKASLWFWMNKCHFNITSGQGFGSTIPAIHNGAFYCQDTNNYIAAEARVDYYLKYCKRFGVSPGDNLIICEANE